MPATTTGSQSEIKSNKMNIKTKLVSKLDSGMKSVLYPKTVAVIGATERDGAVGKNIMENLIAANEENRNITIHPINPRAETILGLKVHKNVADVPGGVEHAVIVTPAKTVAAIVKGCGEAGVKAITVISAGFKEVGEEGLALENEVVAICKEYGMRCIGPNCLGVMTPIYGMNATFAARNGLKGSLGFISQSGAMCTAALDWSIRQKVGFSAFISIGSMADVEWHDIISYLGDDESTSAILIYMETIGNAAKFLEVCKKVTPKKPVIVIKAGKSDVAAQAAASHTGSLAGSHASFIASMKRCGVLAVDSIRELFDCAVVISKQPAPKGPNLIIVTNAGGPGVLATDACACNGGEIMTITDETVTELDTFLPSAWSKANPVDILGDANAEVYTKTMEVCLKDKNADGVLVVLSPQSTTEPLKTAQTVVEAVKALRAAGNQTPVITSWMGGIDVSEAYYYLNENGVPCIEAPDDAAKTFCLLYKQATAHMNAETESINSKLTMGDGKLAFEILKKAQDEGQEILSEYDSKMVMKSFGIPIVETIVAVTAEAAAAATKDTLFPCVVKLHSDYITHKSDVGGVLLNIKTEEDVKKAFQTIKDNCFHHTKDEKNFQGVTVQPMLDLSKAIELLAGSVSDPQFGPLVVFGAGGCMVEVYEDVATGIPPLALADSKDLVEQTKIKKALHGVGNARFPGVCMDDVYQSLINFSHMVAAVQPYVSEIEINPLLAFADRVVAVDARICIRLKGDEHMEAIGC